jgi:site-specific recombinase XerD
MKHISPVRNIDGDYAADIQIIRGPFAAHLQALGLASATVYSDELYLARTADWLRGQGRRLASLDYRDIPRMAHRVPRSSITGLRQTLHHWLRFQKKPIVHRAMAAWDSCLDRYARFATVHQGLAATTCRLNIDEARRYLRWQFGNQPARWSRIGAKDIWRYAEQRARVLSAVGTKGRLHRLACFFRWIYLDGECPQPLMKAVPRVANFRTSSNPSALTGPQRRQLLRSFDLSRPQGQSEHAMALCMLDLGLRVSEVTLLVLTDIDWMERSLRVPPVKGGTGRVIPITSAVATALRAYIDTARAQSTSNRVFLRQRRLIGKPVSTALVIMAMRRAYRRCGFPSTWNGTHILRRTFATRLHKLGADMREIGDLLGHRELMTTGLYIRVAHNDLCHLAQAWPI